VEAVDKMLLIDVMEFNRRRLQY